MALKTVYHVLPFTYGARKALVRGDLRTCQSEDGARRLATTLAGRSAGAIAFSVTGDDKDPEATVDSKLLLAVGTVPELEAA